MNKFILSFFKQSVSYVVFNLLEKIIPFILLPIIIRKVSVAGYGEYSFFLTIETVLIPLLSLNISNIVYREYYKKQDSLSKYVTTLLGGYIRLGLVCLIPFFVVFFLFNQKLGYGWSIVMSLFATASIYPMIDIVTLVFRLEQKVAYYGIWQIIRSLCLLSSLLLVVSVFPFFEWLVYSRVIAFIGLLIAALIILKRKNLIEGEFDKPLFKAMITFSLPTVVYSLSSFLFSFSDRFVIKTMLGAEQLGIYSGIYQLSSALSILIVAFNVAWMPWLFDKLSSEKEQTKYEVVKISYVLMGLFVLAGLLWSIIFPFVAKVMLTEEYTSYLYIGWILIFSFVFHGIYCVVSPYTYYVNKTRLNGYIGVFVSVTSIGINVVLVPVLGISGSAIALLVTWFLQALLFFIAAVRIYPMPWFKKR